MVYWSPIASVPLLAYAVVFSPIFVEIFAKTSVPLINTLIRPDVRLLLAKYLSVALITAVIVLLSTSTVELTFSHIGSTTSTTVASPGSPAKMLSPDVMVVALFPCPVVSTATSLGIATVITPL